MITDFVDGPNIRGQVLEEIKSEVESVGSREADPFTDQKLPKSHRDHAREYFDSFQPEK